MHFIEQVLPLGENLKYQFQSKSELITEWLETGIKFIRVVSDEDNDEIIHFSGTTSNCSTIINPSFQDMYELITHKSNNNMSILKSLYNRIEPTLLMTIINHPKITKNKFLINLLSDSNGYMIYNYQFEEFVKEQLGLDTEKSIEFRRSWNKKSIKQRELLMQHDSYYLLETRMPQYFVFNKVS